VGGVGHPDRGQVAAPEAPGELHRIAPIGLDPVAGLNRHQGRSDHEASDAELCELPVQGVAAGAGFVAGPEGVGRAELADQLPDGLGVMGNHPEGADLAGGLSDRDRDRIRVDIQPDESCTLHG
jgi:hypothetical protein